MPFDFLITLADAGGRHPVSPEWRAVLHGFIAVFACVVAGMLRMTYRSVAGPRDRGDAGR